MFDFSFAELLVVIIFALIFIGPKELPSVIKALRSFYHKIKNLAKECTSMFDEIEEIDDLKKEANKVNDDIKRIVDLDGKLQDTYDISDLLEDDKSNRSDKDS